MTTAQSTIESPPSTAAGLRPKSIGDVFDEAFDLYKNNFALFAGTSAILHVPVQIAFGAISLALGFDRLDRPTQTDEQVGALFAGLAIWMALMLVLHFIYVIHSGALAIAVSERVLGRPITIGGAYKRLRPNLFKLIGTWLLVDGILVGVAIGLMLLFATLMAIVLGVVAAIAGGSGEPGVVLSTILIIVVFVIPILAVLAAVVCFADFVIQIVVLEGAGYSGAIQRNWALLRGRFWPPFWASVLLVVLVPMLWLAIVGSIEGILQLAVYNWLPVSRIAKSIIEQGFAVVVSLFVQPFLIIALTVLYFDQRVRREGFDIDLEIHQRDARNARAGELAQ